MKLLENYALQSGQKIKKIEILEKYYPTDCDKYVLIQPYSKPAKNFDYWDDVIEIIYPILKKHGISLIQVGSGNEKPLPHCNQLGGKTSLGQTFYLVSKALLILTTDSFCSHLAGHYDIPRVILVSNNYSECVSPYFGNSNKQIILEPNRTKRKPSFQLDEGPKKQIDEIRIEDIAKAVCQQLNLVWDFPYKTLYIGETYQSKILEMPSNAITNISNLGADSIVVRLDYEFNEKILELQMQHCPVVIVTDKSINLELLKNYKPRIRQIFYIITKSHNSVFANGVRKLNIPLQLFSYLSENELNTFKLEYLDIATILPKEIKTKENIKEIEGVPLEKLYYKSSKHILSQ